MTPYSTTKTRQNLKLQTNLCSISTAFLQANAGMLCELARQFGIVMCTKHLVKNFTDERSAVSLMPRATFAPPKTAITEMPEFSKTRKNVT